MGTAQTIWNFFTSRGLSPSATAGVMGNLQQESGLNPSEHGGYLSQWGGSRLTSLDNYASSQGTSPSNLQTQLQFMWGEMQSGNYINVNQLNTYDAEQAALYFSNNYEKPAAWAANNTGREQYAQSFYNEFAGGSGSGPATGTAATAQQINLSVQAPGSIGQFADEVQQATTVKPIGWGTITSPGTWFVHNADAIGLRVSLVLIGLLFVAFALVKAIGSERLVGGQ